MVSKRVRLSSDNGSNWYTLPGNSAELRNEAGEIVDTIFGQTFQSTESGLIGWSITANAIYKGFSGYVATIKQQGTSTAMTAEAMSVVTGLTYQIDAAIKQIWDRTQTLTVLDNAIAVAAADIESFDYLFGKVTFITGYTLTGPITITGNYYPTANLCGANSFTLTQNAEGVDNTDMCTAQANGGYSTWQAGLRTVSLELSGIYSASVANFAKLTARTTLILELNPDGGSDSVARGFFRLTSHNQSGNVGDLEEESVTFQLRVPDDSKLLVPFAWNHSATTTLNQAIKIALDSWEDATQIDAQYLHDGTNGLKGDVIITEISLTGGLEAMNEFSVTIQGSGATIAVP